MTALRFKASGAPRLFDDEHLEQLRNHSAGRQRIASADGIETGWIAGGHMLDTDFELAKNIVNDALCFEIRIDSDKIPSDRLRAYYEVELKALTKNNKSGFPSARQKREAKEIARERLEQEAKDGRYRKHTCVPVLWDRLSNEVLFGATSITHVDRMCSIFEQTFGVKLEAMTAGERAHLLAEASERKRQVEDSCPSAFIGSVSEDYAWIAGENSRDFLGNEFLHWLWYQTDVVSDTVKVGPAENLSEVTIMLARSLTLECPRGQTGHEVFTHEGPTRLPESRRAIQAGKLPRKAGITLVRHDQQYEFAIHAETLAIASAKLPAMPDKVNGALDRMAHRVTQIRELLETFDLLYAAFLSVRLGSGWAGELAGMQKWLKRAERVAA
jgi:hypothetical protein